MKWIKANERLPLPHFLVLIRVLGKRYGASYNPFTEKFCSPLQTHNTDAVEWLDESTSTPEDGWVSVEEKLPKVGKPVQVWQANKFGAFNEAVGARTDQAWIVYYDTNEEAGYYQSEYITHWRERNEPAKK